MAMKHGIHLERVSASTVAAIDERLMSNAAALILDDFIVAVDVGMRPYAARLLRATLEEEYQRPVRFACLTHYHADHAFGLQPFKDVALFGSFEIAETLVGGPDWSPDAIARWRRDDPDGGDWLNEVEFIVPALLFRERLDITNRARVAEFHHSGGHTRCSVYGYLRDERVIFAGDLLFSEMFPFAGDVSTDPERWMATLRSWLTMDVDHVIPGHGADVGIEEVEKQLKFLETLKQNTIEAIENGRDHDEIVLPATYPQPDEGWVVERTTRRWHSYYGERCSRSRTDVNEGQHQEHPNAVLP